MKTSSKILGWTLIVLVASAFMGIIAGRLYLNSVIGKSQSPDAGMVMENEITRDYRFEDFNAVEFSGNWKISIASGTEYRVSVTAPSNLLDRIEIKQDGMTLDVTNSYDFVFKEGSVSIRITMPELEGMTVSGAVDLDFRGFTGENLKMILSGAGRIRGLESRYDNLELVCSGAGQLDFTDCLSVNADVSLSGAGEVLLTMDGGVLGGNISGMGSVEYGGTVKENRLKVSGLGNVSSR